MNMDLVCVDSSIAIKWIIAEGEERRYEALCLLEEWMSKGITPVAPIGLFDGEVRRALHRKYENGLICASQWSSGLSRVRDLVKPRAHPGLDYYAFAFERYLGCKDTHDTTYLALAVLLDCEFWTNDNMSNAASGRISDTFAFVKLLCNYKPQTLLTYTFEEQCGAAAIVKQMEADNYIACHLNSLHPSKIKEPTLHFIPGVWGDGSNGSPDYTDHELTTMPIDSKNGFIGES